jgi:hypothetical protein
MRINIFALGLLLVYRAMVANAADVPAPTQHFFEKRPLGITLSIKMVGPYAEAADLQIICLFKHKDSGDIYLGAVKDTDAHLNGLLSALRNRGEFAGELGETFLFAPMKGTIPAKRFMVVGLGDEKELSLDSLRVVGRIAAREAVRLKARHVAWAPMIRDEGNSTIEVGLGDRTFLEEMLSAYDTERRLQAQGFAPRFEIEDLVIEAGPTYFDSAVKEVGEGIDSVGAKLSRRKATPFVSIGQ